MDLRKQYRKTLTAIGVTLLLWVVFFNLFMVVAEGIRVVLEGSLDEITLEIVASVLQGAAYLSAFMLPAVFFRIIMGGKKTEPMRLGIKLRGDSFVWIWGGIACAFAFATLNAMLMSFISVPDTDGIIKEAFYYVPNHSLVLQFITMALVPAFCEEFLFRGVILSNLMPYGKGLAIIVSSVFFGLMHGNFYQFLYTAAAGIMLGTIYVVTDSIWCPVLMHMINNALSVLQTAVFERFTDEAATTIWIIIEGVIFLVGIICVVYLVYKYGKKEDRERIKELGVARGIETGDALKGFFNPAVIGFIVYAILNGVLVFFMMQE